MTEANRLAVAKYRAAHPERVKEANRAARLRYFRSERGREAHRAHGLVLTAVRNGAIERSPCLVCGDGRSQGHHHRGYGSPLDVVWLCALHHKEAHRDNP